MPFCPTLVPVPLALEMKGGSRRPKTPQGVNNQDTENKMVQSSEKTQTLGFIIFRNSSNLSVLFCPNIKKSTHPP